MIRDKSEYILLLENELNRLNEFEYAYKENMDKLLALMTLNEKSKYDFTRISESYIDPSSRESIDKQKIRIFQNNPSLANCEKELKNMDSEINELELKKKQFELIMTNIRLKITTYNTIISYC